MISAEYLTAECAKIGVEMSSEAAEKLDLYAKLLVEWNEKMNLTAITEPTEITNKHFIDSLYLLKFCEIPQGANLIDVGTGAGFPGMVLKIVRPDINLTLLDSLNKRLVFLQEVANLLGIEVKTLHSRAEDAGRSPELRESFDFATARAVARLSSLCEYCLPLVKIGGKMISMKGSDGRNELDEATFAIKALGGSTEVYSEYELPNSDPRSIILIKKISQTPPKYPRQGVKISKKPL